LRRKSKKHKSDKDRKHGQTTESPTAAKKAVEEEEDRKHRKDKVKFKERERSRSRSREQRLKKLDLKDRKRSRSRSRSRDRRLRKSESHRSDGGRRGSRSPSSPPALERSRSSLRGKDDDDR